MNRLFINLIRFLFDSVGSLIGPPSCSVEKEEIIIEKDFKLIIYTSKLIKKKNVIIYYHGGGWMVGSLKAYDNILRYLCSKTGFTLIGVEYRKAPEYKYPIAVEDSHTAYLWVLENIIKDDQDVKISLIGDSAGGSLVVGLISIIKQTNCRTANSAILIYPAIGITTESLKALKITKPKWLNFLGYYAIEYCLGQYLKNIDEIDSLNSDQLILSSSTSYKAPKMLILMAEWDPLSKLIIKWKEKQLGDNQDITCITYPKTLHGFINFARLSRQARSALEKIVYFLK